VVIHVDLDCFFVSVGLLSRPELANQPVGVSNAESATSTAVVSSCNYAARRFGIRNGMRNAEATAKCPQFKVIPYEFDK
jgi:DNA repair protein REV1